MNQLFFTSPDDTFLVLVQQNYFEAVKHQKKMIADEAKIL